MWWHYLTRFPRRVCLLLIRIYQKSLSPDHGLMQIFFPYGVCRFRPTCSEYGYQAIERFGFFKGGWLTFKRINRCHPWHPGGWDPVPEK